MMVRDMKERELGGKVYSSGRPKMPDVLHSNLPIIQVAEKTILDELLVDPKTGCLILLRLSDTAAIIEPGKYDALVTRLRKLGHTPKVDP